MKVAIYCRPLKEDQTVYLQELIDILKQYKVEYHLFHHLKIYLADSSKTPYHYFEHSDEIKDVDYFISLGGDGTMLDSVIFVRDTQIPILGINIGRLGFLSTISKTAIALAIDSLINSSFAIDKRALLHLTSSEKIFSDAPFALNEFVIQKREISSMIRINVHLNGELLTNYWADGLMVSTPTGSTAYNLSCNGPIVFPDSNTFVITPIAPHNLNLRPIIVPDKSIISFEIQSRSTEVVCSLDARTAIIGAGCQLAIEKEKFSINLIRLNEQSFLSTLKDKLTWGNDTRNVIY
ncbi:MAG: NAD kinase [Phycisphaerales bacterium]|nr:NAD kinase [Phycisphaerales bacterium]